MSKSKMKRARIEAEKIAARKAIEEQFARSKEKPKGLAPGALTPKPVAAKPGDHRSPGYYGHGGLKGVIFTNSIGKARA